MRVNRFLYLFRRVVASKSTLRLLSVGLVLMVVAAACTRENDLPQVDVRATSLNKTIMCPICPGESIDQAQNELAIQMRGIVREKIVDGWSDAEIKDFFVERYGPSVILEPPTEGFGLAAWIIPPVALAFAVAALLAVLRVMRNSPSAQPEGPSGAVSLTKDERDYYFKRIETALQLEGGDAKSSDGGKRLADANERPPL